MSRRGSKGSAPARAEPRVTAPAAREAIAGFVRTLERLDGNGRGGMRPARPQGPRT